MVTTEEEIFCDAVISNFIRATFKRPSQRTLSRKSGVYSVQNT
jgi:hypothetical protein